VAKKKKPCRKSMNSNKYDKETIKRRGGGNYYGEVFERREGQDHEDSWCPAKRKRRILIQVGDPEKNGVKRWMENGPPTYLNKKEKALRGNGWGRVAKGRCIQKKKVA